MLTDFEMGVMEDILKWLKTQPKKFDDMRATINAYWNDYLENN